MNFLKKKKENERRVRMLLPKFRDRNGRLRHGQQPMPPPLRAAINERRVPGPKPPPAETSTTRVDQMFRARLLNTPQVPEGHRDYQEQKALKQQQRYDLSHIVPKPNIAHIMKMAGTSGGRKKKYRKKTRKKTRKKKRKKKRKTKRKTKKSRVKSKRNH